MKAITSSSKPADKMDAYLQGHWPVIPSSRQHGENDQIKRRARRFADEIRGQLNQLPVLERAEIIESLALPGNDGDTNLSRRHITSLSNPV